MLNDPVPKESAVNIMDTDQINLSPAKRARRCLLNLLVLSIFAVGAYVGLRSDGSPFRSNGIVVASSDAGLAQKSASTPTQQTVGTKDAPIQVSMKNSIPSAYLVAQSFGTSSTGDDR